MTECVQNQLAIHVQLLKTLPLTSVNYDVEKISFVYRGKSLVVVCEKENFISVNHFLTLLAQQFTFGCNAARFEVMMLSFVLASYYLPLYWSYSKPVRVWFYY